MSNFQTILLIIFVALLLTGVLIFSGVLPGFRTPPGGVVGSVTLWGTVPTAGMDQLVADFNTANQGKISLTYVAKNPLNYEADLLGALASLRGPDLFFFPSDWVMRQADKVTPLSYQTFPLRDLENNFVDETGLYLKPTGLLALPLYLDPLVLYYNKDLLASAGLVSPPTTWTKLKLDVPLLTKLDDRRNLLQSAVAMGQVSNIKSAKDLLTTLLFQAGDPITTVASGEVRVVLDQDFNLASPPAVRVVDFFNQFSNPSSATYSWNRSLPEALDAFAAGSLAYYFGYASEYSKIGRQNPHLNFDVAVIPQKDEGPKITFARMMGLAISRQSQNQAGAAIVAGLLSQADFAGKLATKVYLPPARKDLLAAGSADPVMTIFQRSALLSRSWLDPNPAATQTIFRDMIESANTGRVTTVEAVGTAADELTTLFSKS